MGEENILDKKDLNENPVNIIDLINYQEGAVVSRTLIKTSGGTITVFAFDKEQALSEHTAPFDAFIHLLEGEAEVVISRKSHTVKGGQMLIIRAGEPHSLKAREKFKMLLCMVRS